ncbi:MULTISPECIES: META domain-containing protein [Halomonadaceae]|uniref:META domain-containing protein n=1 Tax=Halomonadaceae TaxID=28256 RepID=UPI00200D1A54|nr:MULTISPECIES: META domain-containing protein [Halomonas]
MVRPWMVGVTFAVLLAGCSSSPAPAPERGSGQVSQASPVIGPRWQVILLGTDEGWSGEQPAYIEVEPGRGGAPRLTGSNGCNTLNGEVRFDDGNRIQIGNLASTRMACPNADKAQRVEAMLENAYRYLIDHDRLVFFGSDSRVLGAFQRR